jgi:protein kinase C substrate 80K-H
MTRQRDTHQNEITNAEGDLQKHYGPHDIFRALKDVCEEVSSGEYTYEHCFTQHTTQKPTRGGSNTNMGYFTGIEFIDVEPAGPGEEDEGAEGLDDGSGRKIVLKYENGQQCWNGPARSTSVVLTCSEESQIWRVVEEEKCVYRMDMGSPAACLGEGQVPAQRKEKDEL